MKTEQEIRKCNNIAMGNLRMIEEKLSPQPKSYWRGYSQALKWVLGEKRGE